MVVLLRYGRARARQILGIWELNFISWHFEGAFRIFLQRLSAPSYIAIKNFITDLILLKNSDHAAELYFSMRKNVMSSVMRKKGLDGQKK